jgi:predicted nucleic acid-binding protein
MIAVCNTSPISSLIQIGHLTLLEKLIAPLLDALRGRARFWISDDVLRRALELAGESPPAVGR